MSISFICGGLDQEKPWRATIDVPPDYHAPLKSFITFYLPSCGHPDLSKTLIDGDTVHDGYVILVNGRNVVQLDHLNTIIEDGTTVLVTAHVVGG